MYTCPMLRELKQVYKEAYCKGKKNFSLQVQATYDKAVSLGLITEDTVTTPDNQYNGEHTYHKSVSGGSGYFRKGKRLPRSKCAFMYTGPMLMELKQEYKGAYCKQQNNPAVQVQATYAKAVSMGLITEDPMAIPDSQYVDEGRYPKSVSDGSGYFRGDNGLLRQRKYAFMYTGPMLRELKQKYKEAYCRYENNPSVRIRATYDKAVSMGLIIEDTEAMPLNRHIGQETSSVYPNPTSNLTVIEWQEKDYFDTSDMSDSSDEPGYTFLDNGVALLDKRFQDQLAAPGMSESDNDPLISVEGGSGLFRKVINEPQWKYWYMYTGPGLRELKEEYCSAYCKGSGGWVNVQGTYVNAVSSGLLADSTERLPPLVLGNQGSIPQHNPCQTSISSREQQPGDLASSGNSYVYMPFHN